ncbi:MAG: hypothetical protein RKO66_04815 [Candidatus Contendobacter sp.]|nr:hypothetical protein [Candidatus Contendobacter sp.]MDS4058593.1 hypothetical protein [Candidatus Contendobacter sp.]
MWKARVAQTLDPQPCWIGLPDLPEPRDDFSVVRTVLVGSKDWAGIQAVEQVVHPARQPPDPQSPSLQGNI